MENSTASVIVGTPEDFRAIVAEEIGKATAYLSERLEAAGIGATQQADLGMMTADEVAAALKIAPRELRRLVKEGGFLPPHKISKRRIRWARSLVQAFINGSAAR